MSVDLARTPLFSLAAVEARPATRELVAGERRGADDEDPGHSALLNGSVTGDRTKPFTAGALEESSPSRDCGG